MPARRLLPLLLLALAPAPVAVGDDRPPNVVLFYADDLGYADLGCYGSTTNPTPNLDRLASEGLRFTDFYVAQAVCTASRAALLTGCYPNRLGLLGALGPRAKIGIADEETLLPEALKSRGYATAMFGKWHLGRSPRFLPTRHGFDAYLGLPYSNDMWPKHPTNRLDYPELPLIEGDRTIEENPDQRLLTRRYTEAAERFIREHAGGPLLVEIAYAMPHVPLHASPEFEGRTGRGLYADVIAEIDDSVGRVLEAVRAAGLEGRTLVVFASDNGPWLSYGDHAGSAGPLREGKGTSFDGGVRVPCIMRFPGVIPAGSVCREPAMTIDLLPTIAQLAGADLSGGRPIDGRDIGPLLRGEPGAHSPHEALFFYWNDELQAVRSGRWKLHFPHMYRTLAAGGGKGGRPAPYREDRIGLALFDLEADPGETRDVVADHPDVVARLSALADAARDDLGDSLTGRTGRGVRRPGRVE